jgi:hypothetical protein
VLHQSRNIKQNFCFDALALLQNTLPNCFANGFAVHHGFAVANGFVVHLFIYTNGIWLSSEFVMKFYSTSAASRFLRQIDQF